MKKITHQTEVSEEGPEQEMDEFCREVVRVARANDYEVNAAANAPFLYARIRARINAEPDSRGVALAEKTARQWNLRRWLGPWRWVAAGAALALLLLAGGRWMRSSSSEERVAKTDSTPKVVVAPTPSPVAIDTATATAPAPQALKEKPAAKVRRVIPAKSVRVEAAEEEIEIATDYLPLTYVANSEEQSGQVMRVEMPRSAMLALGLPVEDEPTGERVKADVIVGDDGLALAIRFVHTATKRPQ